MGNTNLHKLSSEWQSCIKMGIPMDDALTLVRTKFAEQRKVVRNGAKVYEYRLSREGRRLMLGAAMAAMMTSIAEKSAAETECMPYLDMVMHLSSTKGQSELVSALATGGEPLRVYVSPEGTWTMVMLTPDKDSCILATGTNWVHVEGESK